EDMFDAVSYNKGGAILHMLRDHVGEEAFYKALNHFLNAHKFGTAEADQLRLSFEEITGKDMNWFFNQWYYGNGHPKLKINYEYDDAAGISRVIVAQTQNYRDYFILPVWVDVYEGDNKKRFHFTVDARTDTLLIAYKTRPALINFDAERILLSERTDHKTEANYVHQYKHGTYLARREALDYFAKNTMPEVALGLQDKYAGLRRYALQ